MALTIETGAIVANADSYATVAELTTYAAARGQTIAATDAANEILLRKAMDYINAQEHRFQGERVDEEDQLHAFPRYNVCRGAFLLPHTEIPREVKYAQMALAIEAYTLDLLPTIDADEKGSVIEETVHGAVTLKYAAPAGGKVMWVSAFAKADALLATVYRNNGLQLLKSRA